MIGLAKRRRALQAADELLTDLEIDQERPIDVFNIIDHLGLWLAFNRLDNLLGAVIPKGSGGIMLTTQRGPAIQRYTAAHEIAHWILDVDEPAFDDEASIFQPGPDRERLAQLFAGQLLMPPPLVFSTCTRYGLTTSDSATGAAVYLAARDMRTSFEATVRQLEHLGIIGAERRDVLLSLSPSGIKTELCHGHRPRGQADVWPVDLHASGSQVEVTVGDEVVVALPENRTTGYRWLSRDELEVRARRVPTPPPAPFTELTPEYQDLDAPVTGAGRTKADVSRALQKVPGNAERARILPAFTRIELPQRPDTPHPVQTPATVADPPDLLPLEDSFRAGWAAVDRSAARSLRQTIAGRRDVGLPESIRLFRPMPPGQEVAAAESIVVPLAATGERVVAFRAIGEGARSLDLAYASATDPGGRPAAVFLLEVGIAPTPEVNHRRQLIEYARSVEDLADGASASEEL